VSVAHSLLGTQADILSDPVVEGLEKAKWPGRCQEVIDPGITNTTWFLDGAHTVESLDCCMEWFIDRLVEIPRSCVFLSLSLRNCSQVPLNEIGTDRSVF
jgi:folylpolyglutamate synthase